MKDACKGGGQNDNKFKERFDVIERLLYPQTVRLIKDGGVNSLGGKIIYINGNHDSVCRVFGLIPNAATELYSKLPISYSFCTWSSSRSME